MKIVETRQQVKKQHRSPGESAWCADSVPSGHIPNRDHPRISVPSQRESPMELERTAFFERLAAGKEILRQVLEAHGE
ncbi:MAG: hypothetical protein KBH99_03690 [Syntrophobacteraceae bacterium]|nr:hypothetical protein [Syntrophobacteraceae bacterium]